MIIDKNEQGSKGWYDAHIGRASGSLFHLARSTTGGLDEKQQHYVDLRLSGMGDKAAASLAGYSSPPKSSGVQRALAGERVGLPSTGAQDYAFKLALERVSGAASEGSDFETWQMRRGKELEADARAYHGMDLMIAGDGEEVQEVGFVISDCGRFGVSPDGMIAGADGKTRGCEYKCFVAPDKLRAILLEQDLSGVMDQIQGGMWVTGWDKWEFGLYVPQLKETRHGWTKIIVERDDDYIAALEADLLAFDEMVEGFVSKLR